MTWADEVDNLLLLQCAIWHDDYGMSEAAIARHPDLVNTLRYMLTIDTDKQGNPCCTAVRAMVILGRLVRSGEYDRRKDDYR